MNFGMSRVIDPAISLRLRDRLAVHTELAALVTGSAGKRLVTYDGAHRRRELPHVILVAV